MISLLRIATFVISMAAASAMIWFGLSYWQVVEGSIAAGSFIAGVIIAILVIQFCPTLGANGDPCVDRQNQPKPVKHRNFKILANIASFLLLGAFSCAAISFGLDIRGAWESWISTTCVIVGALAAILAFVQPYEV